MSKYTHLNNRKGVTLTELIVSSVLVGIIMIGVVSFNFAMKRIEESSSRISILSANAATFLSMIKKDAMKATGYIDDSGVRTFQSGGNRCICFRHDEDDDPNDYDGDVWKCYLKGGNDYVTRKTFGNTHGNGAIPTNTGSCGSAGGGAQLMRNLIAIDSTEFYNVPGGCGTCAAGTQNLMEYIEINFTAIYDPASGYDPLNNPTVDIRTRVNPIAHNRS